MPSLKKTSLHQFYSYCLQNHLPIALYRLPQTLPIKVVAQKNSRLIKTPGADKLSSTSGFVFAPFYGDKNCSSIIIAPEIFTTATNLPALNFVSPPGKTPVNDIKKKKIKESTKHQFIAYVKQIQAQIKKGRFKKVVAARVVKEKKPPHFDAITFYTNLCKKYPAAFVSLVYTPQYGLWIGASPEILLSASKQRLKTYSLAGTRANTGKNKNTPWGAKELQEQKFVSQYIQTAFKKITPEKPFVEGPQTITAGNLQHLLTTFTYAKTPKHNWPRIVSALHPTPAVAGLPKKESIQFIAAHEKAPRAFYSGYIGPVNLDKQISLFVNLRCMQVLKNNLAIYTGCGITAESIPDEEWKETKMKSQTLLNVL